MFLIITILLFDVALCFSPSSPLLFSKTSSCFNVASSLDNVVEDTPPPRTFREAEILGLRLMQRGQPQEALEVFQQGLTLPGSRPDIIRSKTIGTSPVGGASGGTEGKAVQTLDEFELQAAHYNIACAYAQLGRSTQAVGSLAKAFKAGFDNYETARVDPDLSSIHRTTEFEVLMEQYDPKKGFPNPFSFLGKR